MIRIGIVGYGNLARGAESSIRQNPDMQLCAVFTRRAPSALKIATENVPVVAVSDLSAWKDKLDLLLICGGSATDLPEMTPSMARDFDVIDTYDNHSSIPAHYAKVDAAARETGHIALISTGWDPGLFSLARCVMTAALPQGEAYTFWGKGVSQGHSDAVRRIPGVKDARQYTIPVDEAVERVRSGENPELTTREKHTRLCYVVAEEGADKAAIEQAIVTMPAYFEPYDTTVVFISEEEMKRDHAGLPHGGRVIRGGITGEDTKQVMEFSLQLGSNPEFTGSVMVACARAICRMKQRGITGCQTILDIAPADMVQQSREELIAHLL